MKIQNHTQVFFSFVILLVFFLFGKSVVVEAAATTVVGITATTTVATTTVHNVVQVEKQVREFFADIPVMIEIAQCESKFRQFTDAGTVLRGGASGGMIGIFQFFESVHSKGALTLGFDLDTVEGNLGYARHLYNQSGTAPWRECIPVVVPVATTMSKENKELQIKLLTKVVELLTELLKIELSKR
jgi:uncharacterized membrane protein YdfJ with MMPL/SSD domain